MEVEILRQTLTKERISTAKRRGIGNNEKLNLNKGAGHNYCPKAEKERKWELRSSTWIKEQVSMIAQNQKEERMELGSKQLQPRIEESRRYENPG